MKDSGFDDLRNMLDMVEADVTTSVNVVISIHGISESSKADVVGYLMGYRHALNKVDSYMTKIEKCLEMESGGGA